MSSYYEDDTIGIIYRDEPESSKYSSQNNNNDNNHSLSDSHLLNTSECNSDITQTKRDYITNNKETLDNSYKYSSNTSVLNNLKESIRSNFKSIKIEKEKYSNKVTNGKHTIHSEKTTIDSKRKTEKEKLFEYYKDLKSSSRLNTSNTASDDVKYLNANIDKNINNNVMYDNSVNIINEYVIYNSFKNMFKGSGKNHINNSRSNNDNKYSSTQSRIEYSHQNENENENENELHIERISDDHEAFPTLIDTNRTSNDYIDTLNEDNIYNRPYQGIKLESSVLNDLDDFNQIQSNVKQSFSRSKEHSFNRNLEQDEEELNLNTNTNFTKCHKCSKCKRCTFYKHKLNNYKKSFQLYRKKYLKQKKSAELLNLKLYYEMNKNSQNLDKLSSTNATSSNKEKDKEETRLSNMLCDKLEGNMILFEKLENEIINKNILIKKQDDTISNQNETISKLLQQFDIFTNQGNYLINDIILLKQNIFDKNIKEVGKDFDSINETINNYTNKIKEFSEKSKNNNIDKQDMLLPIEEANSESKESIDCEELSFDFSKSDIDHAKKSFQYDRSLRMFDLNYSHNNDFMLTQSNNSENNFIPENLYK